MTFANSLDPDKENVGPDLDPKPFDTLDSGPEINFEKSQQMTTKA